jgi:hypothetical protein
LLKIVELLLGLDGTWISLRPCVVAEGKVHEQIGPGWLMKLQSGAGGFKN